MAVLLEVFESPVVRHQTEGKQFVHKHLCRFGAGFCWRTGSVCLFQLVRGDVYLVEGLVSAVGQVKERKRGKANTKQSFRNAPFPRQCALALTSMRTHTHTMVACSDAAAVQ